MGNMQKRNGLAFATYKCQAVFASLSAKATGNQQENLPKKKHDSLIPTFHARGNDINQKSRISRYALPRFMPYINDATTSFLLYPELLTE